MRHFLFCGRPHRLRSDRSTPSPDLKLWLARRGEPWPQRARFVQRLHDSSLKLDAWQATATGFRPCRQLSVRAEMDSPMRFGLSCLAVAAVVIIAVWTWLGSPVPQSPLAAGAKVAGEKLYCMSYAPYRDGQNPFDPTTFIPAAQIDEDLTQLSKIT